jgi:hypothetical protein
MQQLTPALLERPSLTGYTLPVGTVRIRLGSGGTCRVRMIKIRMDGPPERRWIHYARWWWEKHRGPVPPGKRVFHADGNTLNDDPRNYAVGIAGDSLAIWHDANPDKSRQNYVKCRSGTRINNQLRGEINRSTNLLTWSWYAVDLNKRVIHQGPVRKRNQIWTRYGMPDDVARSRNSEGAALGWPTVGRTAACILSVLADCGAWLTGDQLVSRVRAFAAARGWSCFGVPKSLHQYVWQVPGRIVVRRRGGRTGLYHIAPSALKERRDVCPIVPMRGRDLSRDRFASFERRGFARTLIQLANA